MFANHHFYHFLNMIFFFQKSNHSETDHSYRMLSTTCVNVTNEAKLIKLSTVHMQKRTNTVQSSSKTLQMCKRNI